MNLDALNDLVESRRLADEAATKIACCRTRMLMSRDAKTLFFATLALSLQPVADESCETGWTDGRTLGYNPAWIAALTDDQVTGFVVHEVLHCANGHFSRLIGADQRLANVAFDLAINPIIVASGITLPDGGMIPGHVPFANLPTDRSAEHYYDLLKNAAKASGSDPAAPGAHPGSNGDDGANQPSSGPGADPGRCGEIRPATKPGKPGSGGNGSDAATTAAMQAAWQSRVSQAAAVARQRGDLSADLAGMIETFLNPKLDWREVLADFATAPASNDYSWSRPNRRFVADGLYMPGVSGLSLKRVGVSFDCSGSVSGEELAVYAAETVSLLETMGCEAVILKHDTRVRQVTQWMPGDGPIDMTLPCRGGTSHVDVFDHFAEHAPLDCVVCFTDAETRFPDDPDFPTLWVVTGNDSPSVPFGRMIRASS